MTEHTAQQIWDLLWNIWWDGDIETALKLLEILKPFAASKYGYRRLRAEMRAEHDDAEAILHYSLLAFPNLETS